MKWRGLIYAPKPFFGSLEMKKGRIHKLTSERMPRRIDTLILPGFISTHVHTIQTGARNRAENMELLDWLEKVIWPFEASLNSKTAYQSASNGMRECLKKGITCILDMATTRHTNRVFDAARDTGIRAFIGKALMNRGPRSLIDSNPLDEVFELLNDWHGFDQGRLQVTLCPRFVLSCSDDLLRKVGELSYKLNLLHHTHASENKHECAWIQKRYKKSNIELLEDFGCLNDRSIVAHGVHLSSRDRNILKKRQTRISHCPTSNLKLASGIADIKTLDEMGIPLSLGVDGAPCNNLLDPFFEMRLAHLLSRSQYGLQGVSAQRIFELATINGAKALHADHEIGSIEEGKSADILQIRVPENIEINPRFPFESLIHSITSSDLRRVFVRGKTAT